jgi:Golgi phosphoprotein 3 (GPP34)
MADSGGSGGELDPLDDWYVDGQVTIDTALVLRTGFKFMSYANPVGLLLRAAVLADLIFMQRLVSDTEGVEVRSEPTGFGPADLFLTALTAHPGYGIDRWLRRGPGLRPAVGEWLVADGRWEPRSVLSAVLGINYRDVSDKSTALLRSRLEAVIESAPAETMDPSGLDRLESSDVIPPSLATAAALVQLSGAFPRHSRLPAEGLVNLCGEASWLVLAAQQRIVLASVAATSGGSGG